MSISGMDKDASDGKLFETMDFFSLEPAGAAVAPFGHMRASAFHACTRCHAVTECREWLTARSTAGQAEAPRHCLDADLLAEFLAAPLTKKEP